MMRKGLRAHTRIVLTLALAIHCGPASFAAEVKRNFTVRDSIEMAHFGTIIDSQPDELDDDGIVSPDGRYVVKLTHRGTLPAGQTEGTIWLWDAAAVHAAVRDARRPVPAPFALLRMSSASNGSDFVAERDNVISALKWSEDSQNLYFLGRNGGDNRQLFRMAMASGELEPLSLPSQNVVDYAVTPKALLYLEMEAVSSEQDWWSTGPGIPDVEAGTGSSLLALLYPHQAVDLYHDPIELGLWVVIGHSAQPVLDANSKKPVRITTKYIVEALSISPDGGSVATTTVDVPPDVRGKKEVNAQVVQLEYRIIDLHRGESRSLPVPVAETENDRYRAAWSPKGDWIAVSNATRTRTSIDTAATTDTCDVAVVSLTSAGTQCISITKHRSVGFLYSLMWNSDGSQLIARYRDHRVNRYSDRVLRYSNGRWSPDFAWTKPVGLPLMLHVRETPNDPPVLVANDPATGNERAIWDPNPQLAEIALGTVTPYQWKDPNGRTVKGGLVKPPDWMPGKRYPLVLQTHGFDSHQFYRVGYSETSNAGRALAGRNIVVLQVTEPSDRFTSTWQDPMENGTNVYLAAIDQLAAQGLIDPSRVGITGYSRSGHRASAAITFAPDRFAAAALSNTDPGSLSDYFTYVDYFSPDVVDLTAQIMAGAKPYGTGIQQWINRAPGFSTDKIRAPVLISAADPFHLIELWSLYASLRDQGKPVDLQYIRSGMHNIAKPLHKLAHQEMLVDWFDFWLNGHEDDSADKADQYVRWRGLRSKAALGHGDR